MTTTTMTYARFVRDLNAIRSEDAPATPTPRYTRGFAARAAAARAALAWEPEPNDALRDMGYGDA